MNTVVDFLVTNANFFGSRSALMELLIFLSFPGELISSDNYQKVDRAASILAWNLLLAMPIINLGRKSIFRQAEFMALFPSPILKKNCGKTNLKGLTNFS